MLPSAFTIAMSEIEGTKNPREAGAMALRWLADKHDGWGGNPEYDGFRDKLRKKADELLRASRSQDDGGKRDG